jgi:Tol biopolymer transport system component
MPSLPVADWANHPTISADGRRVAFDAYRSTIPDARRLGEIRVVVADLPGDRLLEASHATGVRAGRPRSAYHSALSADGQSVTFEVAEGNMNYAKRYGQMRVALRDLTAGRTHRLSHRRGSRAPSRTAYNPTLSGDGRLVAFEAAGEGATGTALWLVDRDSGRAQRVGRGSAGATYEPRLSGDGRVLVFSAADAGTDGRALVFTRDVATGTTTLVSRAGGADGRSADDDAYEPSISADGRVVAFTSAAANLGERGRRSRIWVRDSAAGTLEAVSGGTGAFAFDPAISADGRYVAFASRPRVGGRPATGLGTVWLHDRQSGRTTLVSRRAGAGGGRAGGLSSEPSVSADGARVAFTSTAGDLDRRKPGGLTGVFVRDLAAQTTQLLSTHDVRRAPPVAAAVRARAAAAAAFSPCVLHADDA